MKKHLFQANNKTEYKNLNQFKVQLIISILLILFISVSSAYMAYEIRTKEHKYLTETITVANPARYDITISYKKDPIDFVLISPSGKEYSKENSLYEDENKFRCSTTDNNINISINTAESGDWTLRYNHAYHNRNLSIGIKKLPYEGLILQNISTEIKDNTLYVSFYPYTGNGKDKVTLHYYILCYGQSDNVDNQTLLCTKTEEIASNQEIKNELELSDTYLSAACKSLRIVCYENQTDENETYYQNIRITQIKGDLP